MVLYDCEQPRSQQLANNCFIKSTTYQQLHTYYENVLIGIGHVVVELIPVEVKTQGELIIQKIANLLSV